MREKTVNENLNPLIDLAMIDMLVEDEVTKKKTKILDKAWIHPKILVHEQAAYMVDNFKESYASKSTKCQM